MEQLYYKPEQLAMLQPELEQRKNLPKKPEKDYHDIWFERWIRQLAKASSVKRSRMTEFLSPGDIANVAGYVSHNCYRVNCRNLYQILHEKAQESDWEILYNGWQDRHRNESLRRFLLKEIDTNEEFLKLETKDQIKGILNRNFMIDILKTGKKYESEEDLKESMRIKGIREDSALFKECIRRFRLICSEKAYLNLGDEVLTEQFRKSTREEQVAFLLNLLQQCKTKNLCQFPSLLNEVSLIYTELSNEMHIMANSKWDSLNKKFVNWYRKG